MSLLPPKAGKAWPWSLGRRRLLEALKRFPRQPPASDRFTAKKSTLALYGISYSDKPGPSSPSSHQQRLSFWNVTLRKCKLRVCPISNHPRMTAHPLAKTKKKSTNDPITSRLPFSFPAPDSNQTRQGLSLPWHGTLLLLSFHVISSGFFLFLLGDTPRAWLNGHHVVSPLAAGGILSILIWMRYRRTGSRGANLIRRRIRVTI